MKIKRICKSISIILIIIISVLLFSFFRIYSSLRPPSVGLAEKRNVSNEVEEYLTKKYGDNNFKVTEVDYDFDSKTLFDYSEKKDI